jgi:hypothetical protein
MTCEVETSEVVPTVIKQKLVFINFIIIKHNRMQNLKIKNMTYVITNPMNADYESSLLQERIPRVQWGVAVFVYRLTAFASPMRNNETKLTTGLLRLRVKHLAYRQPEQLSFLKLDNFEPQRESLCVCVNLNLLLTDLF